MDDNYNFINMWAMDKQLVGGLEPWNGLWLSIQLAGDVAKRAPQIVFKVSYHHSDDDMDRRDPSAVFRNGGGSSHVLSTL